MIAAVLLAAATAASPNILFITVDTLRADRLGCYGYEHPTSPVIDRLAEQGLVFEDMIVEEPQTGPSFIAMFTSLPPRMTGTTRNAVPLGPGVPTMMAPIVDAGYDARAVVSNWNLKRGLSNLHPGFEVYEDDFGKGLFGFKRNERRAKDVTDMALAWFEERDEERPFFYWVHYMDPHGPYRFRGGHNPQDVSLRDLDRTEQVRARYDSEVAFTDHHIGRLLEAAPRENTYIVFTSDHGESLMEHGYLGHTREIYQQMMHVPLIVAGPGIAAGRSSAPVRGIDMAPTLLGLAKLAPLPGMRGVDIVAAPPPADRVRPFEAYDGGVPETDDVMTILADRAPSRQGMIHEGWKLMLREGDTLLFDLKTDGEELNDVAKDHGERVTALRERLSAWEAETPRYDGQGAVLTKEDVETLRALGYVE